MNSDILPIIVIGFVMSYLVDASKKKPKKDIQGNTILQLPSFYYLFGLALLIGGIGLILYLYIFDNHIDKKYGVLFGLFGIIPGALLYRKGYVSHIMINDLEINETTMLGNKNSIKWSEIQTVSFSKMNKEIVIKSKDNTIKAHVHLVGFPQLVATIEAKTGKSVKNLIVY